MSENKMNLAFTVVVERIMAELDKGNIPWKSSWTNNMPFNAVSKKLYRGINFFLLSMQDFADPRWLTFKQVQELKGTVKKGSKSTAVVFWSLKEYDDEVTGETKKYPILRYYNVFNVEQCDNLNLKPLANNSNDTIMTGESIVDGYKDKPEVKFGPSYNPCYVPRTDVVNMPPIGSFKDSESYYATLFHELGHSTGAEKRLNRKGVANYDYFGSSNYSEEELIAEFSAAFLCAACNIDNDIKQNAAYIQGWKKSIADNPKILVLAASKAQKAADYILGKNADAAEAE
jgi:antirestriction protein ArdC